MQLLTPLNPTRLDDTVCQFLAASLHAKSIFGEHALMNVSIELKKDSEQKQRQKDGEQSGDKLSVSGRISTRCKLKLQGIALSLGEKTTIGQRFVLGTDPPFAAPCLCI